MKVYKTMFIIAFLVVICSLSFVSASESDNGTVLENDVLSLDESDSPVEVLNTVSDDSSISSDSSKGGVLNTVDDSPVNANYNSSQDLGIDSSGMDVLNASDEDKLSYDSYYGTRDKLNKLVEDALPGSTVTLDEDFQFVGDQDPVKITKSIVIDGKGHKIFLGANPAFDLNYETPYGKIEIKNIVFLGGCNRAITVYGDCCPFVISGCSFSFVYAGLSAGALDLRATYKSYVVDCTFNACHAEGSFTVVTWETLPTMSSTAFSDGGAIYCTGPMTIQSCRFDNCSAGDGGAIYARDDVQIIDCIFAGNHGGRSECWESPLIGGAVYIGQGYNSLVKGCRFIGNHAGRYGGAIATYGNNARIEDCLFDSNYLDNSYMQKGGAIFVSCNSMNDKTDVNIARCTFINNGYDGNEHYCKDGGAIYLDDRIVGGNIVDCNFTGNRATKCGGAIYSTSDCNNYKISNSVFSRNKANDKGGAIYLDSTKVVVQDSIFDSNSADDDGGAIYVESRYNTIKNALFTNNTAKDEGGALYINARYTTVAFSSLLGNAAKKGYDIYCDSSYCTLSDSVVLGNNPKEAIYSSKAFSAKGCWWGNVLSNKNVKPDVEKKVNLGDVWLYLKEDITYGHTGSLPTAVLGTGLWSPVSGSRVTNYPKFTFDMSFTNVVSNSNTMVCDGLSDFIYPLSATDTAVTLSRGKWSYKINMNFDSAVFNNLSLSHLKNNIDHAGGELTAELILDSDYGYMDICDKEVIDGFDVSKNLVLDGNGHTIDGKNVSSLFNTYRELTLKNLNLVNLKRVVNSKTARDIYIENCTFTNCGIGFDVLTVLGEKISIKDSKFYDCYSESSIIFCNSQKNYTLSMVGCEFIGNNASSLVKGTHSKSFNIIQNIFLNNNFAEMFKFTKGNPSNSSYDLNWFGNTINDYNFRPNVNVDLDNWMVLDIVNDENTFGTKYIYLKPYNATSQVIENSTYLNIGFNVSSEGKYLGFVDVVSGVGVMDYLLSLNYVTLSHLSSDFLFYVVNYLPGSFSHLQHQINNAGADLNLTCNYEYMPVCDSELTSIVINKPLILNGNGFTIDAKDMASIARITGEGVQILNVTFANSFHDYLPALLINANNVLINSTFINNTNYGSDGGAIKVDKSNNVLIESTFFNNTACEGGAISSTGSEVSISGIFLDNSAKIGAAVYIDSPSGLSRIYKSLFVSNHAKWAVVDLRYGNNIHNLDVSYSIFLDNEGAHDIGAGKMSQVYADYNWFGNTNENYTVKPKVGLGVNVDKWLFLDVSANSTLLKSGESAIINVSLNNVYDRVSKKVYSVGVNLPDFSFDVESVNNAVSMQKLELVGGKGYMPYVPIDEGVGSVAFKYYSINRDVEFKVVSVPEDSFTKLQEIINNASAHDSIVLNRSYKYYPDFDGDLNNGIVIDKALMINGNGHVIDGANRARLFNLTTTGIEVQYLILVNAYAETGSVIYSSSSGNKLSGSYVLNSTGPLIYCPFYFVANENWFGNTVDDYDVAPVVDVGNLELNNWLFLTVDVSKFDLFVGEKAIITLNLTNMYNANSGTNSTFTSQIPVTFDLSCVGGEVNLSEATLIDGIAQLEFIGDGIRHGYLEMSCYNVTEELYFDVSCDDDSFTALQKLINNATGKIVLQHDYKYYDYDGNFKDGIKIDKAIEIDGNGHIINASNKAGVFNIVGEYVAVYDLSIVNSINSILIDGGYAAVDNISFINNADVISVVAGNMEILGCYFRNNSNVVDLDSAYEVFISNSTFVNNTDIINASYSVVVINNTNFIGNDVGSYCVYLADSNAKIYSSKFNEVNLVDPIFVSVDSELYLSNNTLSSSQYILNDGVISSKTHVVIAGEKYRNLSIYDNLTLSAKVYDDNGNVILINDLEFNVDPVLDYNESSQGLDWILNVHCYPDDIYEVMPLVFDSLSNYETHSILLNVSKFPSSVDIVSLNNITYGEVLNVKIDGENLTTAVIEIRNASGDVIYRATDSGTEFSVYSLDTGIYTLTCTNVGDDDHASSSSTAMFEVYKMESDVVISDVGSIYAFNDYKIYFTVTNRTNVTVTVVDRKTGSIVLNDNVSEDFVLVNLHAGSYNLTVTNVGDNNHETSYGSIVFEVFKVISSVNLDDVADYFYDDVSITYELVNASEVNVVIRDVATGGIKYNFTSTSTTISDLYFDSGRYNITLYVEESESCISSSDSKLFNVLKIDSSIVIDGLADYVYGDDVEVDIIVDNRTTVVVAIKNDSGVQVFNGTVEGDYFALPDLSSGKYTLFANNLATDNVAGSNYTKSFKISKANSTFDLLQFNETLPWGYDFIVLFDGENLTDISVIVRDSNGNVISGGNLTYSGSYFYIMNNLSRGKYAIDIINNGNENITGCNVSWNLTIFKGNSTVEIKNISSVYVDETVFIAYYVMPTGIINIVITNSTGNVVFTAENVNSSNITVSGLPAGNYTVNVTNLETKNVFGNYSISNFTVYKYESAVTIHDMKDAVYGENVLIGFEVKNPTIVHVKITDSEGKIIYEGDETNYSILFTNLDVGDYVINITNMETPDVAGSNASKSFKVTKALLNLTVSVDNTPYGVPAVVNVTSNIDDIYTILIGGEELAVSVVNGSGSASIFLEIGDYSTVTSYDPYNYEPNITEARFSVLRNSEYDFIVDMVDKTVFFSLPMYATGNVTLRIANKTYVAGLINGSANITVPELAEGSNNVQINYTGDSHFVGRSFSTNFTVDTRIVASDMTCAYNSNLSYLVKIIDNNGNPLKGKNVSLTVNKKTYSLITDDNGVVSLKVDLPVGTYAITITALDCGKTVTKTLNVVKRFTDNKNVVKYYNSNFNYKFRVIGDDGNAVGQGVIVSVKIGKKTYNLKTDSNGYITIKLTKTYVPKTYTLTATYKGYTIKNTIKVKQVLSAKNLKVKKSAKKLVLTAKLKQGKKALKNKKIIFKFKGKKYKAKTNKKGIAKVTIKKNVIKKLKVGKKYKFTVTYLKDTIKRNVKVKR